MPNVFVDSARFNKQVDLRDPGTRTRDGKGGFTDAYDLPLTPSTWFCEILPATAANLEQLVGGTTEVKATHIVTGRYHDGITTKTRLTFNGRQLFVRGTQNPEERNLLLVCLCEEVLLP